MRLAPENLCIMTQKPTNLALRSMALPNFDSEKYIVLGPDIKGPVGAEGSALDNAPPVEKGKIPL